MAFERDGDVVGSLGRRVAVGEILSDLLKGWIEVVATANPLTRLLETGRGLLAGSPPHVLLTYGLAAGLAAAFLAWAMRGLRSAEAAG